MSTRAEKVMQGLKDFQRRTVDTVFDRLWGDEDPVPRFLVADEVGLGKTLVARGVIARTIDHLLERGEDRIDLVYICSNQQIATQNLRRLQDGGIKRIPHADRLTMLPHAIHLMNQRLDEKTPVNIISLTPGTSFNLASNGGMSGERALIHLMLGELLGGQVWARKWEQFFRCGARLSSMRWHRDQIDRASLTPDVLSDYNRQLEKMLFDGIPILDAVTQTVNDFRWLRAASRPAWEIDRRRYELIGLLRQALAQACIGHLDPDLVILDEFQRFTSLLHGQGEGAQLASTLLGQDRIDPTNPETQTRVLMLSATPFKMYTLPDEPEGEDHYDDFIRTVRFLAGPDSADVVRRSMAEMRSALISDDREAALAAKGEAERQLRRVMCRTERLAISSSRDGMLTDRSDLGVRLTSADVRSYAREFAISKAVRTHDPLEYWRSAPYVFEIMESYQGKRTLLRDVPGVSEAVGHTLRSQVRPEQFQQYESIDLDNPKLRWLVEDIVASGAWQVAWLPPALPYYSPGGPFAHPALRSFTKRLIFSSWAVAPKGIAAMLSYDIERRLMDRTTSGAAQNYFGPRRRGLLSFSLAGESQRLTGMGPLALLYPSPALAMLGDPLTIAAELGESLPLDAEVLRSRVRQRVAEAIRPFLERDHAGDLPPTYWYPVAQVLLNRDVGMPIWDTVLSFGDRGGDGEESGFATHLRAVVEAELEDLGRPPDDLVEVLTDIALAGPGTSALRSLRRTVSPDGEYDDPAIVSAASEWAWSLRSVFNTPEIMSMLQTGDDSPYWQQVLAHCVDGNLQAVLDEYAEILMSSRSLGHAPVDEQLTELATAFAEGSGLRASAQAFDFFAPEHDGHVHRENLRSHFAVRYGRQASTDDKAMHRETQVRDAFNSPFWPFVLASTSVGQEGLDFHHYSHAVVHWNLPSNPVDLEQREGRVHRFRGHAVRKNVASAFGHRPEVVSAARPWRTLFDLATAEHEEVTSEIVPDWVFPMEGGAQIERYVPMLPLSRERLHYRRLLRTLAAYRLTLGHPRQSDLIAYVGTDHDLALDLSPRQRR